MRELLAREGVPLLHARPRRQGLVLVEALGLDVVPRAVFPGAGGGVGYQHLALSQCARHGIDVLPRG